MSPLVAALACAFVAWWLGTGVVLWLQRRLDRTVDDVHPDVGDAGATAGDDGPEAATARPAYRRAPIGAALGLAATVATVVLLGTSTTLTAGASLAGFAAAIALWGTFELAWALGFLTGTHRRACPDGARGWSRFRLALGTSVHHEIAVLATGAGASVLLLHAANPTGALSFVVLWLMRWSAKLNLFLGVPNFSTEWFPARHAHLASYVRRSRPSAFFPVALVAASIVAALLYRLALEADGDAALVYALPGTLLALAVLEHLFLALPVADLELWNRWFARPGPTGDADGGAPVVPTPRDAGTRGAGPRASVPACAAAAVPLATPLPGSR